MTHPLCVFHNFQKHQIYFCQYSEPHIAVHLRPHTEALLFFFFFFCLGPQWMGRLPVTETSPSFVRRESLAKYRSVFQPELGWRSIATMPRLYQPERRLWAQRGFETWKQGEKRWGGGSRQQKWEERLEGWLSLEWREGRRREEI